MNPDLSLRPGCASAAFWAQGEKRANKEKPAQIRHRFRRACLFFGQFTWRDPLWRTMNSPDANPAP
jgi:hypothetical protein